ncbi:protein of unknown function (plasmid) [Streptantibioticus cattleyicolor NRRL 8057 = DSM 46488]|nr:protein of unknown function [Streptantibioticus cattleyicolor NRRL 8057 = DSM 46488]
MGLPPDRRPAAVPGRTQLHRHAPAAACLSPLVSLLRGGGEPPTSGLRLGRGRPQNPASQGCPRTLTPRVRPEALTSTGDILLGLKTLLGFRADRRRPHAGRARGLAD